MPVVTVFESNDIILAEIAAGLHFDDFQRDVAKVFQTVFHSYRDVGGLVFGEQQNLVATRNLGGAFDHTQCSAR